MKILENLRNWNNENIEIKEILKKIGNYLFEGFVISWRWDVYFVLKIGFFVNERIKDSFLKNDIFKF